MNLHSTSITATITTAATALAALIGPSPARAQSLPEGMFAEGHASLSLNWSDSTSDTYALADFDIGWRPGSGGTIPLGFALGVDAYHRSKSSGSTNKIALYPMLTYEISPALTLSAGVPRFVSSRNGGYLPDERPFYSDATIIGLRQFFGSFSASGYLLNGDRQPYGLRLDHRRGNLALGASFHRIDLDSGSTSNVAAVAASYDLKITGLSDARVFASFERNQNDASGFGVSQYRIGFAGKYGPVSGALTLGREDKTGGFDFDITTAELNATWDVSESFSARASLLAMDTPTISFTLYGLGAKYRFNKWASLQASISDSDTSGPGPFYELGLSVDF